MNEKIEDIIWRIKGFIRQPIIPTVSIQYLFDKDCSYAANDPMKDKYVYYYEGDFIKGKTVKVKALDHLRHDFKKLEIENEFLSSENRDWEEKLQKVMKVKTTDLGENFVKNEIIKILKGELEDNDENDI